MTLVEKLKSVSGREGDYEWNVEVWRADTDAVANLRVRLKVFRVRKNPWVIPNTKKKVHQETEMASERSVEITTVELKSRGIDICTRFNSQLKSVQPS